MEASRQRRVCRSPPAGHTRNGAAGAPRGLCSRDTLNRRTTRLAPADAPSGRPAHPLDRAPPTIRSSSASRSGTDPASTSRGQRNRPSAPHPPCTPISLDPQRPSGLAWVSERPSGRFAIKAVGVFLADETGSLRVAPCCLYLNRQPHLSQSQPLQRWISKRQPIASAVASATRRSRKRQACRSSRSGRLASTRTHRAIDRPQWDGRQFLPDWPESVAWT